MTGRDPDQLDVRSVELTCPACAAPYAPGDRYCATCGASLPASPLRETPLEAWGASPPAAAAAAAPTLAAPEIGITAADPTRPGEPRESTLWLLSARPRAVFGGGLLLLLLAVLLLLVGQLDRTGTIVMLAIVVAALGLFTIAIAILRAIWTAVAR